MFCVFLCRRQQLATKDLLFFICPWLWLCTKSLWTRLTY